tara:strand:+ start:567 stop:1283 length:717 start_codon:yes stop_codon:yes gene_type:complete
MIRLGINIDHIATVRNARGENHPDPLKAAIYAMRYGADSITIHLREDRRHIKDDDLKKISSIKKLPLNLEMAANNEMLKIAIKYRPKFVCIVPEKRNEITTEGGLNLKKNLKKIKYILNKLNEKKIRTSLFINPNLSDIKISKQLNTKCIEIHTGEISNRIKKNLNYKKQLNKIKIVTKYANEVGLEVHAGHGMDYKTAQVLSKVKGIKEFNIGHFVIGESIFFGLKETIKKFKKISK